MYGTKGIATIDTRPTIELACLAQGRRVTAAVSSTRGRLVHRKHVKPFSRIRNLKPNPTPEAVKTQSMQWLRVFYHVYTRTYLVYVRAAVGVPLPRDSHTASRGAGLQITFGTYPL